MVRPNRPQLALLRGKRGPEVLQAWTAAFAGGDPALAKRYALAVATFLGREPAVEGEFEAFVGSYSPRTRRVYGFAITEFFEWAAAEHGRVVPPHEITSHDAELYVQWLSDRPFSLKDERLRDGDQPERLAIYETVEQLGSADLVSIADALPAWLRDAHREPADKTQISRSWLTRELGRMVLHDLLVRTPTMDELRRENPRLGIDVFDVEVPSGDSVKLVPIDNLYMYSVPSPVPVSRVTIASRLTALSSFWDVLAQGENVEGGQAILRYNVFRTVKRRVLRGLAFAKREAAARANQLTPELIEKLLHAADGPTLAEKRDAALLWFLVLTGARVSEAVAIRRGKPPTTEEARWPGWLDDSSEPTGVWLRRKGNKLQWLPYPPYALRALHAFQSDLDAHKPRPGSQSTNPAALLYVHPDSPKWRYEQLAEADDAPLFPPVSFWGANSSWNYEQFKPNSPQSRGGTHYTRSMTRHGVEKLLKKIARKAGFSDDDKAKVHAHAIRHFAATAMVVQGKPIREVQSILGHESITTTERYLGEERRAVALSGQNEILDYIAKAARPAEIQPPSPREPTPATIETYGVVQEESVTPRAAPPGKRVKKPRPRAPAAPPSVESIAIATLEAMQPESFVDLPPTSPVLPEPAVVFHDTAEGEIVEIAGETPPPAATEVRDGISPGSPFEVYAALEPGHEQQREKIYFTTPLSRREAERKLGKSEAAELETIHVRGGTESVQKTAWLREHYDPWPLGYGLGEGSLLPWFSRTPAKDGMVEIEVPEAAGGMRTVLMPPLPVLSPDQVYPETVQERFLFRALERLTREWYDTAPTKIFGLRRWYALFASLTARLENSTSVETDGQRVPRYSWAPFDSKAKVGEDIRAHSDEYLAAWFEQNAERYTVGLKVLKEKLPSPRELSRSDADDIRSLLEQASYAAVSIESIPAWFVSDDPVREIYESSTEEWGEFLRWLGAITGVDMTEVRKEHRAEQERFAAEAMHEERERASGLLEMYASTIDELERAKKGGQPQEAAAFKANLEALAGELEAMGVPDPNIDPRTGRKFPKSTRWARRVEALLAAAFPTTTPELADPNVLRSELFDPDAFSIDHARKTIVHSDAFRQRFAATYDDRDSECIMRRAARAMWEYVKRSKRPVSDRQRESHYTMLYATMLQYIAWIFPCPEDIERDLRSQLGDRFAGESSTAEYLVKYNREIRDKLELYDLGAPDARPSGLPEGHEENAAIVAAMFAAQDVERGIPSDAQLNDLIRQGVVHRGIRGGEEKLSREQRKTVDDLLADEETRALSDAEIAKRAKVPEDYVTTRREQVGVVRKVPITSGLTRNGRRYVVMTLPDEEPGLLFGPGDMRSSRDAERYLSPRCLGQCLSYMRNAERVLPSPLQAIAAMTIAY